MKRILSAGPMIACAAFCIATVPAVGNAKSRSATAAPKPAEKPAKEEKATGGKSVEVFGDWTASLAEGKAKTCYALAEPKKRAPDASYGKAYVFIANRPATKVANEVSIMMGFPIKEGSTAKAMVGKADFELVAVSNAFFMKDASEETHFVDVLKHGGALIVKAPPLKGPLVVDTYSLKGFKQALERAQKDCR